MASPVRSWIALGVVAFVGNTAVRPAIAAAVDDDVAADPSAPTVTPAAGSGAAPAPPAPYPAAPYPGYPPPGYPPPGYPLPPGYTPPPGYAPYPGYPPLQLTQVHRPRRGLVTGGAITFGVTWGVAASIAFLLSSCDGCNDSQAAYLWIPIAGPLVVAAHDSASGGDSVLYLWSAAQAAGLVMFIVGLVGHDVMEYRVARRGPTLTLAPLVARDASTMALTARW